ncbi:hypothetical protein SDC9_120225 [bioreactor metagenome]|uniref:Adenylate kinase n=1 Tax=bioreactor metagenome TaxID=1076179 RepID=A0A645C6H7_9ZZZZ|nr:adenylate kinase [Oscillospiraceae bacterium]
MIILITGGTHSGKTLLAQKLLERYKYPYLSIDHLKMGLIRSGICILSPESPVDELTAYLWPIIREIVKTNIENNQNHIIEGCYIPFDYKKDFTEDYLKSIKFICIVFTEKYIISHFDDIKKHACEIESRIDDSWCTREVLLSENKNNLIMCEKFGCDRILIEDTYNFDYNPE